MGGESTSLILRTLSEGADWASMRRPRGFLETGDYSVAKRPGLQMRLLSHLCLKDKEDTEARGRAHPRDFRGLGVGYWMPVLVAYIQVFSAFFLFLTIFGMPQKWLADKCIVTLSMQIHKVYS